MRLRTILFIALIFSLSCCSYSQPNNNMDNLKVKLKASFSGLVGYGEVYKGEIIEVLQGQLKEDSITITILRTDLDISELFQDNQSPNILEISFEKKEENVKYSLMPISGMVDKNKTAWTISEVNVLKND